MNMRPGLDAPLQKQKNSRYKMALMVLIGMLITLGIVLGAVGIIVKGHKTDWRKE